MIMSEQPNSETTETEISSAKDRSASSSSKDRPISFYIPLSTDEGSKKNRKKTKKRKRRKIQEYYDDENIDRKNKYEERMKLAAFLHEEHLKEKAERGRTYQDRYDKVKNNKDRQIEELKRKTEEKMRTAEEIIRAKAEKEKDESKTDKRVIKVQEKREYLDKCFREKAALKLQKEEEDRLRRLEDIREQKRALFHREDLLNYRRQLYEERQKARENRKCNIYAAFSSLRKY